ncbi:YfhO family protein [bacterium]|nr:YfhO family protein [bacterium]
MKKHLLAVLFLISITIIFFSPVLFTENTFVFRDIYRYYYPFYHLKVSLIKDGIFPFWNPYLLSGTPLFALIQLGTLYPLSILLYLLPFGLGIKIFIVIHFLLSGIFMYCLGKTLNLGTKASLAASITFSFSSFSLCMISHPNILCSITWLPLIFSIYHTALYKRSLLWIILGGVCLAVQIIAGEPVIVYMTILSLFFYGICSPCGCKYAITSFLITLLVGIGLSLIQLLPFFELTLFSARAHGVAYQEATDWSLHPGELLNLIIPFFSDIMRLPRQGLLLSVYMGIIPLSMILLSVFCFWKNRKKREWFWVGLFVISLLLSLGSHFFLYPLCYQSLPGFNMIKHAVKFVGLMTFCGAILVGYGFNSISKFRKEFFYILFSLFMVCICLMSMGMIKQGVFLWGQIIGGQYYLPIIPVILIIISLGLLKKTGNASFVLLLIILADLFFHGINLNPLILQKFYDQKPPLVEILERETYPYRYILNPATTDYHHQLRGIDGSIVGDAYLKKTILFCNLGLLWRIPDAYGYEALTIRDYEKFIWHIRNEKLSSIHHLLCMLNVKYIASETPLLHDRLELAHVIHEPFRTELAPVECRGARPVPTTTSGLANVTRNIRVYKNTGCLSRAFFVPRATVVANKKEAFYYIMRPEFNPTREVVIFEKPAHYHELRIANCELRICESNQVRIDSYQPNKVVIQAKINTPGFLFLGDTYYPGWKAFVDGKETKIYRANYIFRAIEIASGAHKVEFIYCPQVFKVGMLGSICTILLICIAGIVCGKFKTIQE